MTILLASQFITGPSSVTTDLMPPLQRWLDACGQAGATGRLDIGGTCMSGVQQRSNSAIECDRDAIVTFICTGQATNNNWGATNAQNIKLRGLHVRGANRGTRRIEGAFDGCVKFQGCSGLTLEDIEAEGGTTVGIYLPNNSDVSLRGLRSHDTLADGVAITQGSTNVRGDDIHCWDNGDDGVSVTTTWSAVPAPTSDVVLSLVRVHDGKSGGTGNGLGLCGQRITVLGASLTNLQNCGVLTYAYDDDATGYVSNAITLSDIWIDGVGRNGTAAACGYYLAGCRGLQLSSGGVRNAGPGGGIVLEGYGRGMRIGGGLVLDQITGPGVYVHQVSRTDEAIMAGMYDAFGEARPSAAGFDDIGIDGICVDHTTAGGVDVIGEANRHITMPAPRGWGSGWSVRTNGEVDWQQ